MSENDAIVVNNSINDDDDSNDVKIKVFSSNVWGLKLVTTKRKQRIQGLGDHFKANQYDVICLQELWQREDFEYLSKQLSSEYTCVHMSGAGMVGSGLAVFTKLPVREGSLRFMPFRSKGPIWAVWEGDWFAGKGIMFLQVILPTGKHLTIINTHLQASYRHKDYAMIKALQMLQIANSVQQHDVVDVSKSNNPVVLAGDFNCEPGSLPWNLLMQSGNWREANRLRQPTSNVLGNSFTKKRAIPKVIDHTLTKGSLKCTECKVVDLRAGNNGLSLSDHASVIATFKLSEDEREDDMVPQVSLESTIELCEQVTKAINKLRWEKRIFMGLSATFLIITVVFAVTATVLVLANASGAAGLTAAMAIISPVGSALSLLCGIFAFEAKRAKAVLKDQLQEINFQSKA